jgi:hypothetical protein
MAEVPRLSIGDWRRAAELRDDTITMVLVKGWSADRACLLGDLDIFLSPVISIQSSWSVNPIFEKFLICSDVGARLD